ncbi:hypothetical protein [Streptosporangium sp. G12]
MLFQPTVVQLRGVDGSVYTLADASASSAGATIYLRDGAKGLDAPTYDVMADEYPGIDGGFVRFARATMREIFLPVTITGASRYEMLALKRAFIASLNPKKGLVQLQTTEYTLPQGGSALVAEPTRSITCFYAGGMEGGEGSDNGVHWATYGLLLRAPSPYFQHLTRTSASSTTPELGGNLDVTNPGEVEAQPRFEIRGPLASRFSLVLRNDAGVVVKELRFASAFTIAPNQILVIDTAKGAQSIRLYTASVFGGPWSPTLGDSMWWAFDIASQMWALEPGVNHVAMQVDSTTGTTPDLNVSFLPAYLGI